MLFSNWSWFEMIWILVMVYNYPEPCTGDIRTSLWTEDPNPSANSVCTAGAIKSAHTSGVARCSEQSSREPGCTAFTFAKDMVPNCYMLPTIPLSTTSCTATTNAKTFVKVKTSFSCPPNDGLYHTYRLEDNTVATYRFVRSPATVPIASANCVSSGGILAKVSSSAKLSLLVNIIKNCADFSGSWYWIDGRNDYADAYGVWKWNDGEPMNMNLSFWDPATPTAPNSEHCVLIDYNYNWKFNDGLCSSHYKNRMFFICQKP